MQIHTLNASQRNCPFKKQSIRGTTSLKKGDSMSEEITEVEYTKQSFDYRKEREERIKNKAEKAIFSELGVKSIDEIKSIFDSVESFKKQISDLETKVKEGNLNKNRLEVLKSGIDDEFVDFVVDSLEAILKLVLCKITILGIPCFKFASVDSDQLFAEQIQLIA